jgi:signal transduction histidine kinase
LRAGPSSAPEVPRRCVPALISMRIGDAVVMSIPGLDFMRATLATKFSMVIFFVLALAVLTSLTTVIVALLSKHLLLGLTTDEIPSIRAAEELESTFPERRDILASYLLDNDNPKWLRDLKTKREEYDHWLHEARSTAHTNTEKKLLHDLQSINRSFELKMDEIVALSKKGSDQKATDVLLNEIQKIYQQAYPLCESLIQNNMDRIDRATAVSEQRAGRWLQVSVLSGTLTVGLGGLLIGIFFLQIIFPLRRMARTAKEFTAVSSPAVETSSIDELDAVGRHLRRLMADVVDTQTSLQQSQERLSSAEKLASVGKLAASVAHEIRNPLAAVKMWLFSLRKAVGNRTDLDEKFQIITEEISRLEGIIRNFLEFSRPPALKCEHVPLGAIVQKTLVLLQRQIEEKKFIIYSEIPADPIIHADPQQIQQVLINLLNNAFEATPEGGRIQVFARPEIDAGGRSMAVLRIQDSGPGVPEKVRQHIFEPFFTTKEQGTGLGLCIAANILARHGGRLVLEESSKTGASFAMWLPLAEKK